MSNITDQYYTWSSTADDTRSIAWTKVIRGQSLTHCDLLMPSSQGSNLLGAAWRRHQMETFSALLAICAGNSPGTGELPAQRPVSRSFDVFFDLRLNKRLSKQSWGWWFQTLSHPLWRHSNGRTGWEPPILGVLFSLDRDLPCLLWPTLLAVAIADVSDRWIPTQRTSNAKMLPFDDVVMNYIPHQVMGVNTYPCLNLS